MLYLNCFSGGLHRFIFRIIFLPNYHGRSCTRKYHFGYFRDRIRVLRRKISKQNWIQISKIVTHPVGYELFEKFCQCRQGTWGDFGMFIGNVSIIFQKEQRRKKQGEGKRIAVENVVLTDEKYVVLTNKTK